MPFIPQLMLQATTESESRRRHCFPYLKKKILTFITGTTPEFSSTFKRAEFKYHYVPLYVIFKSYTFTYDTDIMHFAYEKFN